MSIKSMVILCLVLGLAIDLPADERSQLVGNLEAGRSQTIVTYGTSLTAGGAWVSQLQEALNAKYPGLAKVINSGENAM